MAHINYLIAWHWGWLLTTLVIGGVVGFATFARPRTRWIDTPVSLAIILFAVAIVVALLKWFPGGPAIGSISVC